MFARNMIPALAMTIALAGLTGCNNEDPITPPVAAPGLPFPDTPDKLMANFQTIYETKDYESFRDMLCPDFMTILQERTVARYPDVGSTLDVAEERRIHGRMFAGQSVRDPDGVVVPGVTGIEFLVFEPVGTWTQSQPGDQFSGDEWRMYNVIIMLDCSESGYTHDVQGQIKFYATHRDSTLNGVTKPYYQMSGQMDLTLDQFGKGIESSAWGTVKALFR